jgi:hypothetical protein
VLHQQQYISEKLREAEAARRHTPSPIVTQPVSRTRGPIGAMARVAGRRVRLVGEALESWATPQAAAR